MDEDRRCDTVEMEALVMARCNSVEGSRRGNGGLGAIKLFIAGGITGAVAVGL